MDKTKINLIIFVLAGTIAAIYVGYSTNYEIIFTHAEQNTTNETTQNITELLSNRGLNNILYTKSGGIAGINEIYVYDSVTKKITYVSSNDEVKKISLDQAQIDILNNIIYDPGLIEVYDRNLCPDCIQYGLSYSFVDNETLIKISSFSYWTDKTKEPSTEGLNILGSTIEQFIN